MTVQTAPRPLRPLSRLAHKVNAPVTRLLQRPWVESIVSQGAVEDTLRGLHPMLSLTEVRARVLKVINETNSAKTFVLQPNALWQGALAGQFVSVQVEIDGRRVSRMYSLSSSPGARRLAITVQRQPGGVVSNHLHETLRVGDVLTISQAMGEFVLPAQLPSKILLLSAGSGITPVMAMLRDLSARGYAGDVMFVHACRSPEHQIFAAALAKLQADSPAQRIVEHFTATAGRLSPALLSQAVPDLAERNTWMCGPSAWMDEMHRYWLASGIKQPLLSERFAAAPVLPAQALGEPVSITFQASGKQFTTQGSAALLMQAEQHGLSPKHGCRIGICRSCQCTKTSGTVQNLQTGELCDAPNTLIRLCISAARSDVTLDL
ncbi:ferredoxin reductase [Variovorax sp. PCZ-1]|uniref:ferredoxin reductase n=1 Tax=Variovorax sp. PCZ-1 TaxID=2835533 RepID=UPI001BCC94FB|nr:ferredoxin reductase [Variovorax sp. PCZ-1]MBS7808714.1 ferredoxin reductase [Variovorax sp. PCZ-1]